MTRTVTVTGQGTARVVPDFAVVDVAAVFRARSVEEAFAGVTSAVEAIVARARTFVDPEQIGSRGLNVWPAHDDAGRQSGFECRHTVRIRCASLDVAGPLLTAVVAEVGDRLEVEGVSLEADDTSAAQEAAREEAYADAVARANHLAGLAETVLGRPIAISEGGAAQPFGREMRALAATTADMSFEPGEHAIGATLTVTFALGED